MPRKKIPALPLPTLRREEKKLQTRKQVLAAALGEFRDRGFDSASTSAIATLAGVSQDIAQAVAVQMSRIKKQT